MKKVLLAGAALVALTVAGAASAADLPSRRQAPAAYIPPVFTWTGFYAGVNAGYAFNGDADLKDVRYVDRNYSRSFVDGGFNSYRKSDEGSFTGGGQVGYNYQMGSVVFGIEADFNYINTKNEYEMDYVNARGGLVDTVRAESKVEWFGTVRPRLGFTPVDRMMVFITGGLAFGEIKNSATYEYATYNFSRSKSDTRAGWTVGAGAEYAVTNNITVKGEYAYVDLGDSNFTVQRDGFNEYVTMKEKTNFHVVRAGVNYKF